MRVGLIGVGRMGRVIARQLIDNVEELYLFDRDKTYLEKIAEELNAKIALDLSELAGLDAVILAVPDREVITFIKDFKQLHKKTNIINIATNVSESVLNKTASGDINCIGVKFIGQADEIAIGQKPVIIINESPESLVPIAQKIFSSVGHIIVGQADIVSDINNITARIILEAAVCIEEELIKQGFTDPAMIKTALRQVAAGVLKAYSDNNLGPFGREIVHEIRAKIKK